MDHAHSFAGGQKPSSSSGAPFAYQQRLLERTSSRAGSLSRSSSQTANVILTNPTGTRRWTPTHRVAQSLDAVKGRFESERVRSETVPENEVMSPESAKSDADTDGATSASEASFRARYADLLARTPARRRIPDVEATTPAEHKRYSMPAPIIAAPLSPNTTGVTIESPDESPSTSELHRIRLPVSAPLEPSERRYNRYSMPLRDDDSSDPAVSATKYHRARALEALDPTPTGSSTASDATSSSSITSASSRTFSDASFTSNVHRRPSSVYGNLYSSTSSTDKHTLGIRPRSHTASSRTTPEPIEQHAPSSRSNSTVSSSSVMSPKPYRSSYMNQRATRLPEHLTAGRKLGRHLPRIASGEVNDEFEGNQKEDEERPPDPSPQEVTLQRAERVRRAQSETRERERVSFTEPRTAQSFGVGEGGDVAGMRGRLRLSRDMTPAVAAAAAAPLPSTKTTTRWTRGLWADVQRHLLQAYEYLCHIGEAKQWIEGCLGEELKFDIVDMEERMRNGVILAKLVRVFQGEAVVRRIYEVRSFLPVCYVSSTSRHRLRSSISGTPTTSTFSSTLFDMLGFRR